MVMDLVSVISFIGAKRIQTKICMVSVIMMTLLGQWSHDPDTVLLKFYNLFPSNSH